MTGPGANSDNSPGGLGTAGILNSSGVGNGNQGSYIGNLIDSATSINLNPLDQPAVMKTFIYSPDIRVVITNGLRQYDVSSSVVRGQLFRRENSASTFICELTNKKNQYTKGGGLFDRMDRITVYMKRINWVQVFTGYLDTVPFAQMWAGNVTIKATCSLKRLLYTYWNPNLAYSHVVFNQMGIATGLDVQGATPDTGLGDLLGNLVCWVGGWDPQSVHIQDFPLLFYTAMEAEFLKISAQNAASEDDFKDMFLGYDHTAGVMSAAGMKYNSTGPGLGPQVVGAPAYKEQVIKAVDDLGMGPNTKDIQNSYSTQQLSSSGQGARDDAARTAFEQNTQLATDVQSQARTSDAAILAFACVMAESEWLNRANASVPDSMNYPHEGMSTDHSSIGLFQQQNQGWGTVAQRMNPYASAVMFLDELNKYDWRNMDPATAISLVQRNRDGASTYSSFVSEATQEVQGIRAGQGKYNPPTSFGGVGFSSIEQSISGQSLSDTAVSSITSTSAVSQNNASPGSIPVGNSGRPQPDAAGAVAAAMSCIGRPYQNGSAGPVSFDAPGLINYVYRTIGRDVGIGTAQQSANAREKVSNIALAQPGDVVQFNGGQHTAILVSVTPPTIVEAPPDGTGIVRTTPLVYPDIAGIYRYADYGGPGPAPFNPAATSGLPVGVGSTPGAMGGTGSDGQQEPIARNLFAYVFNPALYAPSVANLFSGEKSFIDCQPLIQEVQGVCRSGLRNFASAPNGDFIAYYPDYFGVDGKPVAMTIEDIEMKDVRINLSDDAMTTHVYVSGDVTMGLGQKTEALGWLTSMGVATVENETLFQRLKRVVPGKTDGLNGMAILQKYGVRPLQLDFNMLASHKLEFLVACQLFMQKWAEQYETSTSFTFMPELFPGMRVALANTGIAVYVSEVTHSFDWEQGFSTSAKIMAPSSVNGAAVVDNFMYNMPSDITRQASPANVPGI